jgi:hypothetical protein
MNIPLVVGTRKPHQPGERIVVHLRDEVGRWTGSHPVVILRPSTKDGWISAVREYCGREPSAFDYELLKKSEAYFYEATTD